MECIFDNCGQAVSWIKDEIVFNADGNPLAFIEHKAVFSVGKGDYLGQFDRGLFHDRLGCIVAFTQRATKHAFYLSQPHAAQTPPVLPPSLPPARANHATAPPNLAKPLRAHSILRWEQYIGGCEAQWPWKTRL